MVNVSVVRAGVGPVQAGQRTTFPSLTQSASFLISRTPRAASVTAQIPVAERPPVAGDWRTFGDGPNAW
jgi:hypothetical protein